jgi:hypothetical protein
MTASVLILICYHKQFKIEAWGVHPFIDIC